jgi:SAM-dependent methyltransferase
VSAPDREFLRTTYDDVAEVYDRVRPVPPEQVLDDLVELAKLEPGAKIAEIGCATGQATVPLAERGFEIVGIELGRSLAAFAEHKLAELPDVRIVNSAFEHWDSGGERFDAVVAFNSFHWIDPAVRLPKSAELLREGGALAVFGTRFVVHDDADPGWLALKEDYEAVTGAPEPWVHVDELKDRSALFTEGDFFRTPVRRTYQWDMAFGADEFIEFLRSVSLYRAMDDDSREQLFERIHRRIRVQPDQSLHPTMAAGLYVAERA